MYQHLYNRAIYRLSQHERKYIRDFADTAKLNMKKVSYISTAEKLSSIRQDTTCNLCTDVVHGSSEVCSLSAVDTTLLTSIWSQVHMMSMRHRWTATVVVYSHSVHACIVQRLRCGELHAFYVYCSSDVDFPAAVFLANTDISQSYVH